MRYRLTRKAEEDITAIAAHGIAEFGLDQARQYHDGLFAVFDLLRANPKLARERQEIRPPVRVHPYGVHIVIYMIDDAGILILRVRHGREDWIDGPL